MSPNVESKLAFVESLSGDETLKNSNDTGSLYMPEEIMPPKENLCANSTHRLSRIDIQRASNLVKRFIAARLELDLNIVEHTAPLAFVAGTGVNDELDGTESKSPVKFCVPNRDIPRGIEVNETQIEDNSFAMECEVVQSLAKWKRIMLDRLDCKEGEGIYCLSTSIRKGYKGDVTHSCIADQWDYEVRINERDRNIQTLEKFVRKIWKIITDAEDKVLEEYPDILLQGHKSADWRLPKEITFITSEELHRMFPVLDVHERETAIVNKYGAVFIVGMGWPMADGSEAEEVRAPAYDDWNLNGDIMVKHPLTEYRHEISSMGIRVNKESILAQLEHRGRLHEKDLQFNKAVIEEKLPCCYGGGIGISRVLMLLLRTCHIGEVQCGMWHDEHYKQAHGAGMDLIPDRLLKF